MKSKPKPAAKSFQATLERIPSRLNWVLIRIPFDVSKIWGTRAKVRVKGEINGFAFRATAFPTSKGYHCMLVTLLQRRGHLLSIFYYRTPESRDRRISKMLEAALAFSERKTAS
jgi:hypothetical protein